MYVSDIYYQQPGSKLTSFVTLSSMNATPCLKDKQTAFLC